MVHPDRIDFTQMGDGRIVVQKLRRDAETEPARPRDIPLSTEFKPAGFALADALAWCQGNGYAVRQWPGGARAWKGSSPWVIRTRAQIRRKRQRIEAQICHTDGSKSSLLSLDFAYDG
jgi:hypothetical protein